MLRDGQDPMDGFCVLCWCELEPVLTRLGAIYCHDCVDAVAGGRPPSDSTPSLRVESPSPAAHESEPWHAWFTRVFA